jgi:hypothetical protein
MRHKMRYRGRTILINAPLARPKRRIPWIPILVAACLIFTTLLLLVMR